MIFNVLPIVFCSLKLSTRGAIHFVFSPAFQLFFLEKACETFHLSIIVENSTLYKLLVGTLLQNQLVADEFQLSTCYRLFKLCSPPSKLIVTNITYLHIVDFIKFFLFIIVLKNFTMSFLLY